MQINLSINIDPEELARLLGLIGFKSLDFQATQTAPDASRGINPPAPPSTPVLAANAPATEATEATTDEPATDPESAESIISAALAANGLAPLGDWTPVATQKPKATKPAPAKRTSHPKDARGAIKPGEAKPPRGTTSERLPFEQLDPLVRSELKRLSMDKRIPSHALWDSERDPRLPTLSGVLARYGCTNLVDFAEKVNMLPPLSALGNWGKGGQREN